MGYSLGTLDCQAGRLAICGFGESPQTQRYCQLEVWGELKCVRPTQFGQGIESACYRVLCSGPDVVQMYHPMHKAGWRSVWRVTLEGQIKLTCI